MGNRDDIDEMSSTSAAVLLSILKLIDRYDLYGQVAYPKHHKQSDVPEIYRLAAKTKVLIICFRSALHLRYCARSIFSCSLIMLCSGKATFTKLLVTMKSLH